MNIDIDPQKVFKFDFGDLGEIEENTSNLYEKYFGAAVNLQVLKENIDQACSFYFQMLRKLELAVVKNRIELESDRLIFQQSRAIIQKNNEQQKQLVVNSQRQIQSQQKNDKNPQPKPKKQAVKNSLKQEIDNQNLERSDYDCKIRACNKSFKRKENLLLHQKLKHNLPPHELHKDKIFTIQIKDWSQLSSSKRFK